MQSKMDFDPDETLVKLITWQIRKKLALRNYAPARLRLKVIIAKDFG
ncbi:MAG TPA: hypothetical protein VLY82_07290 [Nitrososphaerales archaeon]|nr:hypothetical protein [Nitrososphaerales archaeon]